jgi:transcriptional regulator with PAS, ATPase and Fis domain
LVNKKVAVAMAREDGGKRHERQGTNRQAPGMKDVMGAKKHDDDFDELVGAASAFREAHAAARKAAKTDIAVLIIGESGTGKEILARAIHQNSRRREKPLVDVNCAAIPDTLIESELFGYERGAFTGARSEGHRGYFDEAHGGTILLDEIGDSSLAVQSRLLRVLESGTFKRVGATKNVKVDVRVISATNQDLAGLIEQKKFREDLYFRLNPFTIVLPPLRERTGDIPLLVDHFLQADDTARAHKYTFSADALTLFSNYHWPGNVRELKGVVHYALNMTQTQVITLDSLPRFLFPGAGEGTAGVCLVPAGGETCYNLGRAVRELEQKMIAEVLAMTKNKSEAIRMLGISRRTFYLKLKEYGLPR